MSYAALRRRTHAPPATMRADGRPRASTRVVVMLHVIYHFNLMVKAVKIDMRAVQYSLLSARDPFRVLEHLFHNLTLCNGIR